MSYVAERQKQISDEIERRRLLFQFKVGGYLFRVPAYGNLKEEKTNLSTPESSIGRTFPCPCGSGLKYKDCCKPLEIFQEGIN